MGGVLSVTQEKMLAVLSDGMPHDRRELHACLPDELSQMNSIKIHLTKIRRVIQPRGEDIVCQYLNHRPQYRHVRLLHSAADGYR